MNIELYPHHSIDFQKLLLVGIVSILIESHTAANVNADSSFALEPKPKTLRYGTYVQSVNETCLMYKYRCIYDDSSPDIWSSKTVLVTARKFLGNVHNFDSINEASDENVMISENKTTTEILLTPTIITQWVYELGFAISEGNYFLLIIKYLMYILPLIEINMMLPTILDNSI